MKKLCKKKINQKFQNLMKIKKYKQIINFKLNLIKKIVIKIKKLRN